MKDTILEIIENAQDEFKGSNEANLHAAERIAAMFGWKKYPENKPTKIGFYATRVLSEIDEWHRSYWDGKEFAYGTSRDVIAFYELPEFE
jgi:hypothetical protein